LEQLNFLVNVPFLGGILYTGSYMKNTIEILGKIMGSAARVKLMRLFLFHPKHRFSRDELLKKSKIPTPSLRAELSLLEKSSFLLKKEMTIELSTTKKSGSKKITKKKTAGYFLNPTFPLLDPLKFLLLESELVTIPDLPSRFKPAGKIKLFVTAGIFMRDEERTLDILIVGEKLNAQYIQKTINLLESEIGKELKYAVFDTDEFMYRIKMYDKLIRDMFDFPHQKLMNTLAVESLL
jgi:hypothetical protein